jgi:iodotyrosine deiodinase
MPPSPIHPAPVEPALGLRFDRAVLARDQTHGRPAKRERGLGHCRRVSEHPTIPLNFTRRSDAEMGERAAAYYELMDQRRSVRIFSPEPIPLEVVRDAIRTAGTAPSGAHKQPWRFVMVTDPALKHEIRLAAEAEERETYEHRMSDEWRAALAPLGTDADKPYLDIVPVIIAMFRVDYDLHPDGSRSKNYYVQESCGIALGMLIAALHNAGLATLTHTPSPMNFLAKVLDRPKNERAYMLLPVGYPAEGCRVPDLARKPLDAILVEK